MSFATTECIHPTAKKQLQAPTKKPVRSHRGLVDHDGLYSILERRRLACERGAPLGSLLDVLHDLARTHFSAIDIALRINRKALGAAGSLHFERVRNPVKDTAIF